MKSQMLWSMILGAFSGLKNFEAPAHRQSGRVQVHKRDKQPLRILSVLPLKRRVRKFRSEPIRGTCFHAPRHITRRPK